ncbi:MAG: hypothetical protein MMC33_009349 [Icmadophila ericetorum]|nr:hypothetical protein [Icmadophila ericetorum]
MANAGRGTLKVNDYGLTLLHGPPDPIADIVFVHGLQGNPRRAWTCEKILDHAERGSIQASGSSRHGLKSLFSRKQKIKSEVFWPLDLLPGDCPNVRIYTWGYESRVSQFFGDSANKSSITAYARDLLYALDRIRQDCLQRSLIFIAHSLGGLIVKAVLCRAADEQLDIYASTKAVIFLGTPHRGSAAAGIGEILRRIASAATFDTNDKNIRALKFDSPELESIHERFMSQRRNGRWHFEVRTFQEAKGLSRFAYFNLGEKVVDDFSSSLDGTERRQTINANHLDMCRYTSKNDDGYQKVVGELQIILSGIGKITKTDESTLQKTSDDIRVESPSQGTSSSAYSLNETERVCMTLFNASDITEFKATLPSRVEGTCRWVLNDPRYIHWISETKSSLLWISGHPGSGKTILSAYLFDYLSTSETPRSAQVTVCFFFCDEKIETQRDAKAILRSIIFQILSRRRRLIRHVKSAYDIQGSHLRDNFNELWRIFTAIANDKKAGPLNIIVDAIDECEENTRKRFLEGIAFLVGNAQSTANSGTPCIKFILTSRPLLGRRYTTNHLQIEEVHGNVEKDLRLVIQTKLEGIVQRTHCKPETREYLEQALYSKADQSFLWVTLILRLLEKSYLGSQREFQRIVENFPKDLEATYGRFLHSISAEYHDIASKLLHFLVGSLRPLSLEEIRILLAIQDQHRTANEVERDCEPNMRETLDGVLGPLVRISDSRVYLIHQSLKEYLHDLSTRADDPLRIMYGVDPHNAAMLLANACALYLSLDDFAKDLFIANQSINDESPVSPVLHSSDVGDTLEIFADPYSLADDMILKDPAELEFEAQKAISANYLFFDYSATHWAEHFSSCSKICPQELRKRALSLSDTTNDRNANWLRYYWLDAGVGIEFPQDFDTFVTACFFGHLTSVLSLLNNNAALDPAPSGYGLYWASRMGHQNVVSHLLERGVLPDARTVDSQTALTAAAQFDHIRVVAILLDHSETDVNHRSKGGPTPISIAAGNGHLEVVEKLQSHAGVDPDMPDYSGRTPLIWAVNGKYANIVRTLTADSRVNINHPDKQGRTALLWAASEGEEEVIEHLLLHLPTHATLNTQHKDLKGRNALSLAAENGHLETVTLLRRSKRIDILARDNSGRNAISWACSGGHDKVVEYLLRYDRVGADEPDDDGWTPLAWALDTSSPKTIRVLLASGLVDVNRKDGNGRTPLSWAAGYGYVEIVRLLVGVEGVDVDSRDGAGYTPLDWAGMYGFEDVVRCLKGSRAG